ncbi:MAG: hypothetical protein FJ143_01020 [Deltaproteobacteria bacterium]|nr:hypothetical protein [Deltaproteobacteria bacterium]
MAAGAIGRAIKSPSIIKPAWLLAGLLTICAGFTPQAAAQIDFPIGYSSLGGTYAFISLIETERLLEQEGIRPQFIHIGGPQITQALIAGEIRMALDRLGDYTDFRIGILDALFYDPEP